MTVVKAVFSIPEEALAEVVITTLEIMNSQAREKGVNKFLEAEWDNAFEGTAVCVLCRKRCVATRWVQLPNHHIVISQMRLDHDEAMRTRDENGIL